MIILALLALSLSPAAPAAATGETTVIVDQAGAAARRPVLTIGSKRFTESYILGEILRQTAEAAGEAEVRHEQGLGNTGIVQAALASGSAD